MRKVIRYALQLFLISHSVLATRVTVQSLINDGTIYKCFRDDNTVLHLRGYHLDSVCGIENVPYAEKIRTIDLSSNKIQRLDEGDFSVFKNLQELSLARNNIQDVQHFTQVKGLGLIRRLQLSHNALSSLSFKYFEQCTNLQTLLVNNNAIHTLDTQGTLKNLHTLSIVSNELKEFCVTKFNGCPQLVRIFASFNKIETLEVQREDLPSSLQALYLDNNSIPELPAYAFEGAPSLILLYLQNNRINELKACCFSGLKKLRQLLLYDNALSTVKVNVFSELSSLVLLHLRNNNIEYFDESLLEHLENLLFLDISFNKLSRESIFRLKRPYAPRWFYIHNQRSH